jgi:hypothetical protein
VEDAGLGVQGKGGEIKAFGSKQGFDAGDFVFLAGDAKGACGFHV